MAFSSLTSTQFVSNNNLQDGVTTSVFTLKAGQTIPSNTRQITKAQAIQYVNLDLTNTYISAKTNQQLIAKRDLTPTSVTPTDPTTSILSLFYASGKFNFNLTNPIASTAVVITGASVTGSITALDCSIVDASDTITSANPLTITPTNVSGIVTGNTPMACTINKVQIANSIIVNGVTKTNGDTITIGGTTVTISIDIFCRSYLCF